MFPYFHPTTLVMLDDDPLFLESFELRFLSEQLIRTFTDPTDTIRHLFHALAIQPSLQEFLAPHDTEIVPTHVPIGERLLKLKGRALPALASRPDRFEQVAVLVVDFDMPRMNGLQVCRALQNHPVRKILLTGKAGVETGINALNEGIIDAYFAKQDRNLTQLLQDAIPRQRHSYFTEVTRPLRGALAMDEMAFLSDPAFEEAFAKIAASCRAVEHYASVEPTGMVLIQANGTAYQLIVCDELALAAQAELAQDADAPSELVTMLSDQRVIGAFPARGFYTSERAVDWRNYVLPARQVNGLGGKTWFYALGPNSSSNNNKYVVASFDAFLRKKN